VNDLQDHSDIWRRLLQVLPDQIIIVDDHGVIRHLGRSIEVLTGYSSDELIGEAVERLVPSRLRDEHAVERSQYARRPTIRPMRSTAGYSLVCKDGHELEIAVTLSPIVTEGSPWVIAAVRRRDGQDRGVDDAFEIEAQIITSKLAAATMLADSEERFRLAFEDEMAPKVFTDLNDQIITANHAFCLLIGRTKEEILGYSSQSFTHPDDVGVTERSHQLITERGVDPVHYVKRYLHRDGRLVVAEVSKTAARDAGGKALYFVISVRDITNQERRGRVLELRSEVNRFVAVATDPELFLEQLCEVIVGKGGYSLAWVGVPSNDEEGGVEVLCASGATDYLYDERVPWWGLRESGLGPTGIALRTGVSQVVGNLSVDAVVEPWRERATQFEFGSSVAIPNLLEERSAVLNIYDRHVFAFDETTVRGLEEIVQDARFAVAQVQSRDRLRAALEEATVVNATLNETEQRFRLAFENNMAPMVFTNLANEVVAANDAFCSMIGYDREEVLGRDTSRYTHPDDLGISGDSQRRLISGEVDQASFIKRYLSKDGRPIMINSLKSAARGPGGEILYFVSSQRDITEERALTEQLSQQALHDPLTGLANRSLLEDRLSQLNSRILRRGGLGAVLLMDLDDFKVVNDTYGHLVGDQLLVGVARRLDLVTRSSDTLCRFGGDEFLYLAEGLTSANQADRVASRLLRALAEPFTFDEVVLEQHASIGVVVCDGSNPDHNQCIRQADVALYEAKRLGKGRHVILSSVV
jgi:diguanylate cyclase (GGDEF)-like protein/PAS domain S-box-containing protein